MSEFFASPMAVHTMLKQRYNKLVVWSRSILAFCGIIKIYELNIRRPEIETEIRRGFTVLCRTAGDRLYGAIRIVRGRKDRHLHEFTSGKKGWAEYRESKDNAFF